MTGFAKAVWGELFDLEGIGVVVVVIVEVVVGVVEVVGVMVIVVLLVIAATIYRTISYSKQ